MLGQKCAVHGWQPCHQSADVIPVCILVANVVTAVVWSHLGAHAAHTEHIEEKNLVPLYPEARQIPLQGDHQCHKRTCLCSESSVGVMFSVVLIWQRAQPHSERRAEEKEGYRHAHFEDLCSSHVPFAREQLQRSSRESSASSPGTLVVLVEEDESLLYFKWDLFFFPQASDHSYCCCSVKLQYFSYFIRSYHFRTISAWNKFSKRKQCNQLFTLCEIVCLISQV